MFKNQLQELAQRSCFNLPSYGSIREGPDHAPRFKAFVNFNGEIFQSAFYSSTLRQAEHSAAEVAVNALSSRGSKSLTARVLDETGVYKNLLQETAHRAGLNLPLYTTVRSGPGHIPVFTCTVELAGLSFSGLPARTKKQAEKNAAVAAWSSLKKMPKFISMAKMGSSAGSEEEEEEEEEQEQVIVTRVLSHFRAPENERQVKAKDSFPGRGRRRMVGGRGRRKDHNNKAPSSLSSSSSSASCSPFTNHFSSDFFNQQKSLQCLLSPDNQILKKRNSFVDLLPPPPPRTTSKILPLTLSSRDHSSPYSRRNRPASKFQAGRRESALQSTTPSAEENRMGKSGGKDSKCLGDKSVDFNEKNPIEKEVQTGPIPIFDDQKQSLPLPGLPWQFSCNGNKQQNQFQNLISGPSNRSTPRSPRGIVCPSSPHMGLNMYSGGFNPKEIAPSVQIRSIIPACASPPAPAPMRAVSSSSNDPALMKESCSSSSMSIQAEEEEVPPSSLNQLDTEFNKLQLRGV